MLVMIMTDGAQFADYLLDNPLIIEGPEIESTVFSVACMLAKATERERSAVCTFVRSMTTPPEERAKTEKARKRA